jgi:STE24 endopeptidase
MKSVITSISMSSKVWSLVYFKWVSCLWILSLCIQLPAIHEALGANVPAFHIGLIAFGILYSPISMITGVAMNMLSRKNEFEADSYAKNWSDGEALVSGLKKLK